MKPHATNLELAAVVVPDLALAALAAVLSPGQVTELRVFDATTAGDRYPRTLSGYFDNAVELVNALAAVRSAEGVYIVPNPVKPDLLARAANRLKVARRGQSTGDTHVERRRWLLIDVDPDRESGISSTDEEHDAAMSVIDQIETDLRALGWADGIKADSGNGGHKMYPIDLPADDGGLVGRVLARLAAAYDRPPGVGDPGCHVDQTVKNPSRLFKLYGTLVCKGDSTAQRPHRTSRMLSAPPELGVVTREQLEAFAGPAAPAAAPVGRPARTGKRQAGGRASFSTGAFDMAGYIAEHGLDMDGPDAWHHDGGVGRRWVSNASCPWHPDHADRSFWLAVMASGAPAGGCSHHSCKGMDWADVVAKCGKPRRPAAAVRGTAKHSPTPDAAPADPPAAADQGTAAPVEPAAGEAPADDAPAWPVRIDGAGAFRLEVRNPDGDRVTVDAFDGDRRVFTDKVTIDSARSRGQFATHAAKAAAGPNATPERLAALTAEADQLAAALVDVALPGDGGDADDSDETGPDEVRERRRVAGDRPAICTTNRQLRDIVADSWIVLADANDPPMLFAHVNQMVRVSVTADGAGGICPVVPDYLRGDLARAANYYASNGDNDLDVPPPKDVVADMLARDMAVELRAIERDPFPVLEAVIETPIVRADGSILTRPGYDAASRRFYAPMPGFDIGSVPTLPTAADVARSLALIDEAIGDFPFETAGDHANAYVALFTPFLAGVGRSPVGLIDATQQGTGKSKLASVIGLVATGKSPDMITCPAEDEEWRKLLTSLLINSPRVLIFDNLDHTLKAGALARAVTAEIYADRILGHTKMVSTINRASIYVTGNNITVGGDVARRCYRSRMNAQSSRPWRDGRVFRHPNLEEWVRANRAELVRAILTVCRAWFADGHPDAGLPKIGSFEQWSFTVGNILAHAGVTGALGNVDAMYEDADEESEIWERFLSVLHAKWVGRAVPCGDIVSAVADDATLRDCLPEPFTKLVRRVQGQFGPSYRVEEPLQFGQKLGHAFKRRLGRRYGSEGLYLRSQKDNHSKVTKWAIESDAAGFAGFE